MDEGSPGLPFLPFTGGGGQSVRPKKLSWGIRAAAGKAVPAPPVSGEVSIPATDNDYSPWGSDPAHKTPLSLTSAPEGVLSSPSAFLPTSVSPSKFAVDWSSGSPLSKPPQAPTALAASAAATNAAAVATSGGHSAVSHSTAHSVAAVRSPSPTALALPAIVAPSASVSVASTSLPIGAAVATTSSGQTSGPSLSRSSSSSGAGTISQVTASTTGWAAGQLQNWAGEAAAKKSIMRELLELAFPDLGLAVEHTRLDVQSVADMIRYRINAAAAEAAIDAEAREGQLVRDRMQARITEAEAKAEAASREAKVRIDEAARNYGAELETLKKELDAQKRERKAAQVAAAKATKSQQTVDAAVNAEREKAKGLQKALIEKEKTLERNKTTITQMQADYNKLKQEHEGCAKAMSTAMASAAYDVEKTLTAKFMAAAQAHRHEVQQLQTELSQCREVAEAQACECLAEMNFVVEALQGFIVEIQAEMETGLQSFGLEVTELKAHCSQLLGDFSTELVEERSQRPWPALADPEERQAAMAQCQSTIDSLMALKQQVDTLGAKGVVGLQEDLAETRARCGDLEAAGTRLTTALQATVAERQALTCEVETLRQQLLVLNGGRLAEEAIVGASKSAEERKARELARLEMETQRQQDVVLSLEKRLSEEVRKSAQAAVKAERAVSELEAATQEAATAVQQLCDRYFILPAKKPEYLPPGAPPRPSRNASNSEGGLVSTRPAPQTHSPPPYPPRHGAGGRTGNGGGNTSLKEQRCDAIRRLETLTAQRTTLLSPSKLWAAVNDLLQRLDAQSQPPASGRTRRSGVKREVQSELLTLEGCVLLVLLVLQSHDAELSGCAAAVGVLDRQSGLLTGQPHVMGGVPAMSMMASCNVHQPKTVVEAVKALAAERHELITSVRMLGGQVSQQSSSSHSSPGNHTVTSVRALPEEQAPSSPRSSLHVEVVQSPTSTTKEVPGNSNTNDIQEVMDILAFLQTSGDMPTMLRGPTAIPKAQVHSLLKSSSTSKNVH